MPPAAFSFTALLFPAGLLLAPALLRADSVLYYYQTNAALEDGTGNGLTDVREVDTAINSITVVTITLNISAEWNGDLYADLQHGSGLSVLLNRPGRTVSQTAGSGARGVDLTFYDAAAADVHTAMPSSSTGPVTGTFQPDARLLEPGLSFETSPRTAFLSTFQGMNAAGSWTLYVEDTATGGTVTVNSWTLGITGAVPEPLSPVLLTGVAAWGLLLPRRRHAG